MSEEFIFIYTTVPSIKVAESIANTLVIKKLAACVNCYSGVCSIYQWNGVVNKEQEVVLFIKTRTALVSKVRKLIISIHPYDCPAILSFNITDGNKDFLNWIRQQTTN